MNVFPKYSTIQRLLKNIRIFTRGSKKACDTKKWKTYRTRRFCSTKCSRRTVNRDITICSIIGYLSVTWRILNKNLHLYFYKVEITQYIKIYLELYSVSDQSMMGFFTTLCNDKAQLTLDRFINNQIVIPRKINNFRKINRYIHKNVLFVVGRMIASFVFEYVSEEEVTANGGRYKQQNKYF